MIDSFLPADVANVDHAFEPFSHLHKRTEFREAHDLAFDHRPNWKFMRGIDPRIAKRLLQAQRHTFFIGVDSEDHGFYSLARLYEIAGLAHFLDPRHLRNVNQPFDSRLQFHECSEVGNVSYPAAH